MIIILILIILFSPSCSPVYKSFWWNNAIIYQVWTPSFQDSNGDGLGDLVGLRNRLGKLKKIGITAIWIYPFLETDHFSEAVRDHRTVDPRLGSMDDAELLIKQAHEKELGVLITIPLSVTSRQHNWFLRSSKASKPQNANFSGFYHWRRSNSSALDVDTYSEYNRTNISYMHYAKQPEWPILNWQNDSVREQMFGILSFWIDKGIDGFHLSSIEYLARTPGGKEPNWNSIQDIIRDIRNHVDTYSRESSVVQNKKIILFADRYDADENEKDSLVRAGLDSVVNYELGSISASSQICGGTNHIGGCTHEILSDMLVFYNENPDKIPLWQFGNPSLQRLASRIRSRSQGELLTMVQFMLPGTNSFYYGEDIGMRGLINDTKTPPQQGAMQWDDSKNAGFSDSDEPSVGIHADYKNINFERQMHDKYSQLKTFRALAELRSTDETLMRGATFVGRLTDNGFTISRFCYNTTGAYGNLYIAAFNFGTSSVQLHLADIPTLSARNRAYGYVVVRSSNLGDNTGPSTPVDVSSEILPMPPESGVVLKFKE
ncbi:unnamed protein product [Enterobius vermicularis]|uniref:alpha-glucosidase n=1 Tax=Enterobius vermicularis TaxID=51028 RepID=A0A0N4VKG5_ENTVE|nr:unnamed protein product [Enterobius vermicularis]